MDPLQKWMKDHMETMQDVLEHVASQRYVYHFPGSLNHRFKHAIGMKRS